jgi:GT2 family glycosyltransferase
MTLGGAEEADSPMISVVIATRDRGDRIVRTLQSILRNDYPSFEIVVADQSRDDRSERALAALTAERLRYVRSASVGPASGRNQAIARSGAHLIAITDDDCEVSTGWLRELVAGLSIDDRVAVVFGNVVPAPHDAHQGFIPGYVRDRPFLAKSLADKHEVEGMSACMGLRRSVWDRLRGFDEMLGSGAPLKAGAEVDFTIRALLHGYWVYETPGARVVHHGFRAGDEGQRLIERYWHGAGATMAKHVKGGHWSILQVLLRLGWRWLFGRSRVAASLGPHSSALQRLLSFARGFGEGLRRPVDRATGHYAVPGAMHAARDSASE